MYYEYYQSPIGMFLLEADHEGVTKVNLIEDPVETLPQIINEDPIANEWIQMIKLQLDEYFNGARKEFDVPIHMRGTEFQCSVWNALREIPYGETRSYKQIAERIGNPKAARAVGMANNKNHILILVPCHRVIGADGSLVGFGCGLDKKIALLELEKQDSMITSNLLGVSANGTAVLVEKNDL